MLCSDVGLGGAKICWKNVAKAMSGMFDVFIRLRLLTDGA